MALFPAVDGLRDGDDHMDETSINRPINQLRERTDFLKAQLEQVIGAAPFESVRLQNVSLPLDDTPVIGDFVYLEPVNNTYAKALTGTLISALNPFTHATNAAFAVGMVTSVVGTNACCLAGLTSAQPCSRHCLSLARRSEMVRIIYQRLSPAR